MHITSTLFRDIFAILYVCALLFFYLNQCEAKLYRSFCFRDEHNNRLNQIVISARRTSLDQFRHLDVSEWIFSLLEVCEHFQPHQPQMT